MTNLYWVASILLLVIGVLLITIISQRKIIRDESTKSKSIQENLESSIEGLNSELKKLTAKYQDLIDLNKEKSSLTSEIEMLQTSREQTVSELQKLTDEYKNQETVFDSLNTETQKLEENIKYSSAIRENLKNSIETLNEELKRLNEERNYISNLIEEKSSLTSEIEMLQISRDQTVSEHNNKIQGLRERVWVNFMFFRVSGA